MCEKPEFYDETMRFISEFKNAKDVDEMGVVIQSWNIWRSLNNVREDDWASLRFTVVCQAALLQLMQCDVDRCESTIRHLEDVISNYKRACREKDSAVLRSKMYSDYLEEVFLGKPGPSDFPAS